MSIIVSVDFMHNKQIMLKFKKIWLFLLGIIMTVCPLVSFSELSNNPDNNPLWSKHQERTSSPIVNEEVISQNDSIWQWSMTIGEKSNWILHFSLPEAADYDTKLGYVLTLIQIIINRTLGILTFVALVYMLYCWFLILSAWSDDKNASKGKGWIKTAAVALVWIGLSWLIISAMIWFINNITWAK